MDYEKVTLEFDEGVAVLRFNAPEVMNAIDGAMLAELQDAVARIVHPSSEARCLLLTGVGRGFCAGANLTDRGRTEGGERTAGASLRSGYHPLFFTLRDMDMPMVTAVNGAAAGVGMSFAVMADIVCASKQAFFLQAFANIGLVPDGGATFMLPRLVGWGRAVELSLLAERLPAEQAFDWGLVNRLYDDNDALMDGALEIARKLARGPKSLGMIRKAYWEAWHNDYERQIDLEARLQAEAGRTADHAEGVSAFVQKRNPEFTGK